MSEPDSSCGGPEYGLRVKQPLQVKTLRVASLVLACAGLFLLYRFSVYSDFPLVRAGEITPAMNFACVRVSGEVMRDASVLPSGGLVFTLKDRSGEIAVFGSRAQTEELKASGKLPRRGDQVETAGSLNVSAGQGIRLRMQSLDRLTLVRELSSGSTDPFLRLAEISVAKRGWQIVTRGVLKTVTVPGPGSGAPCSLILEEDGVELPVVFWDDAFSSPERKIPVPGKVLEVRGRVDVYKDEVRLRLQDISALRVISGKDRL